MTSSISKFNRLQIPLEAISSATNNFADKNLIGRGAFGKVYKGQFWWSEQWINISARRLDRRYGLGDVEFWAEISMLSSLEHQNIVSIIGFCDEKHEKIIVNKHETRGSLQEFLSGSTLTWMQRLRICVGVAHALRYLRNNNVIHHNINSSTILLDKNWEAKLSGFEFSMKNPSTRDDRVLLTDIGGTIGYEDPEYEKTRGVTYKSDVFSFGIVLFETLCGRKAFIEDDHDRFLAPLARLYYDEDKLHEIVDPDLWKNMDPDSFFVFSQTAYSCLKEQRAQRPNMDEIFHKLEKAYNLQLKHEELLLKEQSRRTSIYYGKAPPIVAAQRTSNVNYWKEKHLEHLLIQLNDIVLATDKFSSKYHIASGEFAIVYKAELNHFDSHSFSSIGWKNEDELPKRSSIVAIKRILQEVREEYFSTGFLTEIEMLSSCKHRNIVSLLGFCDEDTERIIVYEYALKGSLDDYLGGTYNLPWGLRLKICLDIARGLNYLHTNMEDKQRIIHRDIRSANIWLGNNWEAKISDFGLSIILPRNQQHNTLDLDRVVGTYVYLDPEYLETSKLRPESDTYSFGVVLFEILCGRLAYDSIYVDENDKGLAAIARQCFNEGTLMEMVDPKIKEELDLNKGPNKHSLEIFSKVAYQCLAETQVERPTMEVVIKELEKALHFHENRIISLEDIKSATKNFSRDNYIGGGGSAMVYKGELEDANERITIVAKQLKRSHDHGQWKHQYLTERQILLEYKHESIIGLVGYCDQMDENIIVYEHMTNGSLDRHLNNVSLTWKKRLEICIDVASGLDFLHGGGVTQEVVIHRDIKSANILLNGGWKAKIADFGLSLISSIDKKRDFVVNRVCGTPGYCDPLYRESGLLTKESDIYSFGVVLFEILTGRFAYKRYNEEFLTKLVKHKFKEGKLDVVVFEGIKEQVAPISLSKFQMIAYQCLHDEREKRPTTSEVLLQLKKALKSQENSDNFKISLEGIKSATQNFSAKNCIGGGHFGMVYKGEVSHINGHNVIAVKRLHESFDGEHDFLMELEILFEYKHENIIGLAGYCDEMGEKIIVYEYASRGSLDKYLKDDCLTWMKRLEICIDVASGLGFLHEGGVKQDVVIHRDIKSANILLVDDWKAKITGFGFSLVSSINKEMNLVVNDVRSTLGYCDPLYKESGLPTRESDIYSLGVVLFEILSGKFAYENDNAEHLTKLVKHGFREGKFDEIVFEGIKEQIAPKSLTTFQMIAYKCLHDEREKRPTAREVVRQLQKAMKFQGMQYLPHIPLQDIVLATENFSNKYCVTSVELYMVYKAELNHFDSNSFSAIEGKNKGELPKRSSNVSIKRIFNKQDGKGEEAFFEEIENLSSCKHRNIVTLVGFCTEGTEMIIVYEYASKGRLDDYLRNTDHMSNLPWGKRLKICLDIAHGLDYLHTSSEEKQMIIHGDIRSQNILLGKSWEAKITEFGCSKTLPPNQHDKTVYLDVVEGTECYWDPEYVETGKLCRASDIYSFGVVLFEIMCGRLADDGIYDVENHKGIASVARQCFVEGTLKEMVDPRIKEEIDLNMFNLNKGPDQDSLDIFSKVAYQCLAKTQDERPTIDLVIKELEKALHFHVNHTISLEDIKVATKNFSHENCIGIGGFGKIYKGELQHANGSNTNILAKRLDGSFGQPQHEFLTECEILLEYKHENVIGLVGYCDQMDENIIVYEQMCNGGLDGHLKNVNLTWTKRLEICIDVASGLDFLHGGALMQEVVIHRDIKSTNILLDGDWKAKIACFGLSLISSINKEPDLALNHVCGTPGYCDPLCIESGSSTRESDIYSLGVVLFEILSGRLAYEKDNDEPLTTLVKHSLEEGKSHEIVFEGIKDQIALQSLSRFQLIAYQCLHDEREKRPTAHEVVLQLKKALIFQGKYFDYVKIQLKDIVLATENFSNKYCIASFEYFMVYVAERSHFDSHSFPAIDWKNKGVLPKRNINVSIKRMFNTEDGMGEEVFFAEIENLSRCKHRNIDTPLGFCTEGTEMIIVYEYASKGSLGYYLRSTNLMSNLPWEQRLKISLDIAHGLDYLHASREQKQMIIHGDINSSNILLGDNWEAKITNFGFSKILPPNQQDNTLYLDYIEGTEGYYLDPEYMMTGKLSKASDIYSLGVVLFELLCGRVTYDPIYDIENDKGIASAAQRCFAEGNLKEMVDPKIKEEIDLNVFNLNKGPDQDTLDTFSKVAYQCLAKTQVERPTIEVVIKELEKALHFHENNTISFENIQLATRYFSDENRIGYGGHGKIYKGELQDAKGIKTKFLANRLDSGYDREFWTERDILLKYKHENVIGLVGCCDKMFSNIIVYEHMSNGGLDRHLKNYSLTWPKRLEICIDIARGLDFLHTGGVTQEVVIHRDIKSAHILLDGDWKAKIAGFERSLINAINKETDSIKTQTYGTWGYCDPLYMKSGLFSIESDMYSFGVVLSEILSGIFAFEKDNNEFLAELVKHNFKEGKVDEIVFEGIKEQIARESLTAFQMIAYQCLHDEREKRPTAGEVVLQLEEALKIQENHERLL